MTINKEYDFPQDVKQGKQIFFQNTCLENGRERSCISLFLHKNNENTGKIVKINFRALKIGWKLTTIWRLFIHEKVLNISKDGRFCGILYDLLTLTTLKKPHDKQIVIMWQLLGKV